MSQRPVIAVVDDDEAIREALADVIHSLGYDSALYASAEDFLAGADRAAIDCMIVDVRMPGLSGLDLQERLARDGDRPPAIFMTSCCDDVTRHRALAGGASAFLGKPVDDAALIAALDTALATPYRDA